MLPVDGEVELGGAASQREVDGQGLERFVDGRRWDAGDRGLAVHAGAVGFEHVEGALRVDHDAGVGEHVERGLVDALHLVLREDAQRPSLPDVASVDVNGHESPFDTSDSVRVMKSSRRTYSLVTNGEVAARTSAS